GGIFALKKQDIFYTLVVVWAFIGILSKRLSAEITYTSIISTVVIGIGILGVLVVYKIVKKNIYLEI
ncbi:MAG: hypothetical protein R6U59_03690, partial [Eubacteriales bacterium]